MAFLRALRWPLATLTGLILVLGGVLIANPRLVKIDSIDIAKVQSSDQELLFQRTQKDLNIKLQGHVGKYFWQVPLEKIFQAVTKDKRVKSTSIYREFPSKIKIVIEPYTPVLGYLAGDGRIYPIANDGALLPAQSLKDAADLPIVRGLELKDNLPLRVQALDLYHSVPESTASLSRMHISEIVHSAKDGFKIFLSNEKSEVKFGDTDFGPKVSRVQKVLTYLDSRQIKGRVIDARFAKKVVVRVRNNP